MEEKSAEVKRVTRRKMADMEEKTAEMACEKRREKRYTKAETKRINAEAYECLSRERGKVKHE